MTRVVVIEQPIECENCGRNDLYWNGQGNRTLCLWCGHDRTTGEVVEADWEAPDWLQRQDGSE